MQQKSDSETAILSGNSLTVEQVVKVAREWAFVQIKSDDNFKEFISRGHEYVLEHIESGKTIYGVTTGYGDSCRYIIENDIAEELQENLVAFHGCGTGEPYSVEQVRAALLVRLNCNAIGYSGVRYEVLQGLVNLINHRITPVIPQEGSVGASGDLTPLSYIAAVLCGKREVFYDNNVVTASEALEKENLKPVTLKPKEALALMNGTSMMTGVAALAVHDARRLARLLEISTAMMVEVLLANRMPFIEKIHKLKGHQGQISSAKIIYNILKDSKLAIEHEEVLDKLKKNGNNITSPVYLQDKYSIRCAPQIIGVLRDCIDWVDKWVSVEMNSVNDNPIVDIENDEVYHAGNFYGGHIAQAMDSLKLAVANVCDLSDRQIALLVDEKFNNGLTPNLVPYRDDRQYGMMHGFKGMQITATSLTAEALKNTIPASIFSRPTESNNQDKVSLGTTSSRDCVKIIDLTEKVIAIQILALCQATDLRGVDKLSKTSKEIHDKVRSKVNFLDKDRRQDRDIVKIVEMIKNGEL